ncbi:hypothetical protein BG004_000577, partial [Podila humilis]
MASSTQRHSAALQPKKDNSALASSSSMAAITADNEQVRAISASNHLKSGAPKTTRKAFALNPTNPEGAATNTKQPRSQVDPARSTSPVSSIADRTRSRVNPARVPSDTPIATKSRVDAARLPPNTPTTARTRSTVVPTNTAACTVEAGISPNAPPTTKRSRSTFDTDTSSSETRIAKRTRFIAFISSPEPVAVEPVSTSRPEYEAYEAIFAIADRSNLSHHRHDSTLKHDTGSSTLVHRTSHRTSQQQ